jgi:hypothetical protein
VGPNNPCIIYLWSGFLLVFFPCFEKCTPNMVQLALCGVRPLCNVHQCQYPRYMPTFSLIISSTSVM